MVRIDRIESGGLRLDSQRHETFLPWSSLGLHEDPSFGDKVVSICWRIPCVHLKAKAERSKPKEWKELVNCYSGTAPSQRELQLRTGCLQLRMVLHPGSQLDLEGSCLQLPRPLSCCLAHRQGAILCQEQSAALQRERRRKGSRRQWTSGEDYAKHWGALVECEAAEVAAQDPESKTIVGMSITWEEADRPDRRADFSGHVKPRGHFMLPYKLVRAQKLKFRGLLRNGGETASSWLCLREVAGGGKKPWSGHARVLQAMVLEDGKEVFMDEELPTFCDKRSLKVAFEVMGDVSPGSADLIVEYLPKSLSYQVMHIALAEVNQFDRSDGALAPALLARDLVLGKLALRQSLQRIDLGPWDLNAHQQEAIQQALSQPVQLIHGPPGTGKTWAAAVLLALFARQNSGTKGAALFTSPTNRSVDSAVLQTHRLLINKQVLGLHLLRVYAADVERHDFPLPGQPETRGQSVPENLRPFTLHWRCHAAAGGEASDEAVAVRKVYKRLKSMAMGDPELSEVWAEYHKLLFRARAVELQKPGLILFTTCASVRRNGLLEALWKDGGPIIRQVVLDEAAQALEPEALSSLAAGKDVCSAVLLGDHRQMQPVVRSRVAAAGGLAVSLFQRLIDTEVCKAALLAEQYRMHPEISRFPSIHFYDSKVHDAECVLSRAGAFVLSDNQDRHAALLFWDGAVASDMRKGHAAQEEQESVKVVQGKSHGVGSRANLAEARRAATLAEELVDKLGDVSIAILSWYNHQVLEISRLLRTENKERIHVATVATAQGSEWDYVLLSTVRSGSQTGSNLGLLSDAHLLNVSLTRARYGLVILGNQHALATDYHWKALLSSCRTHGCMVSEKPQVRVELRKVRDVVSQIPQPELTDENTPADDCVSKASKFQAALLRLNQRRRGDGNTRMLQTCRTEAWGSPPSKRSRRTDASESPPPKRHQAEQRRCACGNFFNSQLHGRCIQCSSALSAYRVRA